MRTMLERRSKFVPNTLYEWKRGKSTVENMGKYRYLRAADYNDCPIGDCWVVDALGNLHPGYNKSPIPVNIEDVKQLPLYRKV